MPPPDTSPVTPGSCRIDTRIPGGDTCRLIANGPVMTWRSDGLPGLPLAHALAQLECLPGGLLVGVLPYPGGHPSVTATPASLLLFDRHEMLAPGSCLPVPGTFRLTRPFLPDQPASTYPAGVRRVQDYLAAGDAYQVNLAQRFSATFAGEPLAAFEALRQRFHPPFAAFVDLGDRQILCLSPESFLEVEGRQVLTRPIKGTRPRSTDPAIDAALAADLRQHPKDRAENLMIVDLMRNDLGRVCQPGSVQVPSLFALESFATVHHLVSTVSGTLSPGIGLPELLAATFPGGSITGAPKKRAMEIIAELEPHLRDIYCGTIFWALPGGHFGSNIAIRTFLARGSVLYGWAGAGIIADSSPASEDAECRHKLQPLMNALAELGKN